MLRAPMFLKQILKSTMMARMPAYNSSSCGKSKQPKKEPTPSSQIKPPVDGSAAEFFGRKPTIEEIQKLLSPEGFLSETQFKDYDGVTPQGKFEQLQPNHQKKVVEEVEAQQSADGEKGEYMKSNLNEWGMPKEVGFKVKGPEPTRFGDWERKGRVTDF